MKKKRNSSRKIRVREIKRPKSREIKKQIVEVKKEETLEEHVEDSEIFESAELPQFISTPTIENNSPVLEKIQHGEETDLESNIISTPLSRATPQEGPATNYSISQNYFSSSYNESTTNYSSEPSAIPIAERTRIGERVQRQELMDWKDIQAGTREETSWNPERGRMNVQNVEEDRRELPFEKRDKKYKEFRG